MADNWLKSWGWKRKQKGTARIWTHPALERAIVQNPFGIWYDGERYPDLPTAAKSAMKVHKDTTEPEEADQ